MKFRTELPAPRFPFSIDYTRRMVFMGSCFAENMGDRFDTARFHATINPYGVLFNPISLFQTLEDALHQAVPNEQSLLQQESRFYSWNHHSVLNAEEADDLIREIHRINRSTYAHLKSCHVLFVTVGTSWAYRHIQRNRVVANCHKQNQTLFQKELISSEQIINQFNRFYSIFRDENPDAQLVFTVSPVRYLRDGLANSNRSKAELIRAVHHVVEQHNDCHYLPAYEWVMDDLRDYRYYDQDLTHPNPLAIDYLWEKVQESFMDRETIKHMSEVERFFRGLDHKAFLPDSSEHQQFLNDLLQQGKFLQQNLGLNLRYELHQIESQIQS